jgi:hypothetical protein
MLLADIVLIAIALLSIVALATMLGSLWVWVPYVPTPRKVVRRMVELANLKGNETIYDLGCGDARILIEAKKRYPGIRAIGFELPLGIFLLAKLRVWLARVDVNVHMRDYLKADLRDADVLFLYLVPEVLPALERKLQSELKAGTKIISHGFPLRGRSPAHEERCPLLSWSIFRASGRKGPRIFVYRW